MTFDGQRVNPIWSDHMTMLDAPAMDTTQTVNAMTVNATEFKAKCLEILDRLSVRELTRVSVTKRGRVVAVLMPPDDDDAAVADLYGCMAGSVIVPDDVDLTAPVLDEPFLAEQGVSHT